MQTSWLWQCRRSSEARIDNRWQRLVDDGNGPLIGGVVLLGDSSMHTNPTFGRGMSLAFEQAQRLATTLDAASDPVTYTAEFERRIAEHHREWFDVQVATDERIVARFRAALRGEQATGQEQDGGRLMLAMFAAAPTDEVVAHAATRFFNMLAPPSEIFADAELTERLGTYAASHDLSKTDPEGPTRAEFEAMVTAA
jgi:2-polyprenyl-6-methoxyphenol hydroxylase-like FAD-dependent oxidoreductase